MLGKHCREDVGAPGAAHNRVFVGSIPTPATKELEVMKVRQQQVSAVQAELVSGSAAFSSSSSYLLPSLPQ